MENWTKEIQTLIVNCTVESTNFGFEGVKRSVMNGGTLKMRLLQCYEVLRIYNIDAIRNIYSYFGSKFNCIEIYFFEEM